MIEAMDIVKLLLVFTQSFPTNIRYSSVQAALIGAVMRAHFKIEGGGLEKNSWYWRTALPGVPPEERGWGTKKKSREIFFHTPKPEISSTLPHLFGFGRCKEDMFQGDH